MKDLVPTLFLEMVRGWTLGRSARCNLVQARDINDRA